MHKIASLILVTLLAACSTDTPEPSRANTQLKPAADNQVSKINYPLTKKGDVVDTYFDTRVADPYRWLEDDRSSETGAWVKSQNKVTFDYLTNIFSLTIKLISFVLINYSSLSSVKMNLPISHSPFKSFKLCLSRSIRT